ncbi:MAG: Gfo/Idh/MocA family oxidoreductase [Phycisphaerae bacterium]|nr:Gfo/Idh/MocA family oxidoreductase [Phycisphaerae bacterium]NIS51453.1 Gfo/Idh/MocA family oxidoreductase [Phycisphaerae bacterium]NIU09065.1 Gfo/Idh/MocA family oxidoreductase [Phycisphaerae bacterium]NIU56725.1 Gfo/Idh/MocA family oxidoreductase [Phycisphaerae bacterium]NIW93172.1 Gfo/Idh/MocA family oxidoreductase [Phycisphaerae bacterium]
MKSKRSNKSNVLTRRQFLKSSAVAAAAAWPAIVPASVFGADAPSNRITFGCIGVGRMGLGDLREIMGFKQAQILAVCDVDSKRTKHAQQLVEKHYARQSQDGTYKGCATYGDFRDLIARKDIDAVSVVTPDHWHALPSLAAARAGKDIFLQKPLSLTIEEGRLLSDTVSRYGRVFQIGSQQRSDSRFRKACELVRNGRIGKLQTVKVGFGTDPGTGPQAPMPVPDWLDYNMWLGPAPWAAYTEKRVHPQSGYGRPGWLRIADYGAGMITGWGSHHNDIAQWGMGTEQTGPVEIEGQAEFPKDGLWDVHGAFSIEYTYANGVKVTCADTRKNKQGILFEGSEGWVYVRRGHIDANPKSLLTSPISTDEIQLYKSNNHKANLLECIKSRKQTVAPAEVAHRSCSVCLLGEIAMRLGKKLKWDFERETFTNDDQANRMLSKPMRSPWHL